jgi:hypothetical protein
MATALHNARVPCTNVVRPWKKKKLKSKLLGWH